MGGAASIEHMSSEDLYRTAKEAGVNELVREKIREEAISGTVALEYANLENEELTDLSTNRIELLKTCNKLRATLDRNESCRIVLVDSPSKSPASRP